MSERVVVASRPRSSPDSSLPPVEREEVRALLALDVDHLDELARANLVRECGRRIDPDVEPRLGEWGRQLLLLVASRRRAPHLDEELRRRRCAVDDAAGRRGDDDRYGPLGSERLRRSCRRPLAEEADRRGLGRVEPARAELVREKAPVAVGERRPDHGRGRVRPRVERGRVVAAVGAEHRHLRRLAPARVDDRHPLVRSEGEHGRTAGADDVRLDERVLRQEPADEVRLSLTVGLPQAHVTRSPAPSPPSRPPRR